MNTGEVTPERNRRTAGFTIAFDGPAVSASALGTMDFAPAIFGFGGLMKRAIRILDGEDRRLSVYGRLGSEPGSFAFLVELEEPAAGGVGSLDAEELLRVSLGDGVLAGVIRYCVHRAGQDQDPPTPDPERTVKVAEGSYLMVAPEVAALAQDPAVLDAVGQIVIPLRREGVSGMYFGRGANRAANPLVLASDLHPPTLREPLGLGIAPAEFRVASIVVTPPLPPNWDCELSAGVLRFTATLPDDVLLRDLGTTSLVEGESLEIQVRQTVDSLAGGRAVHSVLRVFRRSPPAGEVH
jgi:hypothetical protein